MYLRTTDFLSSLFGQGDWRIAILSGRKPIVYSSAGGYLKAQRIAQDTNGIPVMACQELCEFARLNNTGIFYADSEARPKFVNRPEDEYMAEWAGFSGRDYLGTP